MHSPALGQLMAEMILDGKASTIDVHSLRPSRFAEKPGTDRESHAVVQARGAPYHSSVPAGPLNGPTISRVTQPP